ncbi:uncharacterized protein LOC141719995 [Apium graveolens]|uniref:uncharacterized protein LOC141719995 n=1 Tax=Apium graveolens TaxID=4045 RepID=UPI003D7BD4D2
MDYCCLKLEEWGGGKVKEMKIKIQEFRKVMRKYRSRRDNYGIEKYNKARWEFLKLLEKKEVYWKQRAKQFWLKEGDQNTRFFHSYASGRKKNNQVTKLKDKHGVWKEGKEDIREIITEYFEELFQTTGTAGELSEREYVHRVAEEQNQKLMMPITREEVKEAVFSMYPEKSPGYDGLNPGFYQAYWNIVGSDVVDLCKLFFDTGDLPDGVNHTLVCLIPKKKNPQQMTDIRPISLCNVLFRILSKVLANRLKQCLPSLISEQQSAFVKGRLLTDNALIAFELNHYIRRKTQGTSGVVGLKVDISKAYDRLEWNFLENMLIKFGFNSVWVARIMRCVQTVSYSFIQDGCEFGNIKPKRGIRQGDPISPYLYILCAEGLSSIIRRHEEVGLIHGCSIARGAPPISHLLFADDCYMFFKATAQEARSMKSILQRYEQLSGQAINLSKSTTIFSPNTDVTSSQEICDILQVQKSELPGNYLGLPMYIGRHKNNAFKFLTERICKKLQSWRNKPMSKGGKMVLLKSAAQSIPNFWMNLLLIPSEICNEIQRTMNAFWWGNGGQGKGIRWMSWERLCEGKENGGLAFRDLKKFNVAMLAKQGWRLLNGENPLVTKVMKAKYYPNTNFLEAKVGTHPSYMWRSIMESQEVIKQASRRRIGDGSTTNIWKIPWLPCLLNGHPLTTMPQELVDVQVGNLMNETRTGWDEDILTDLFLDRDIQLIKSIPISRSIQQDSWYWIIEQSGLFTVKSCYRKLVGEQQWPNAGFWKKLWSLELPGKVSNFMWRVCKGVVPTAMALAEKRVQIPTRCSWCLVKNEDIGHVLFDCCFARNVWGKVAVPEVDIDRYQGSVWDFLIPLFNTCNREKLSLIAMVCWSLWNRRNRWIWDKITGSDFGVHAAAINLLNDWKRAQVEKKNYRQVINSSPRHWSPPQQGWVKINVDAALFEASGSTGISSIIRNEAGQFIRARVRRIDGKMYPREAEAVSLKEALSWTKDLGFRKCVFETDAKLLAEACKGTNGRSFFHTIVLDCIEFFKHFDDVLVNFVHRSANGVAHALARAAHSMSGLQEWHDVAPEFISDDVHLGPVNRSLLHFHHTHTFLNIWQLGGGDMLKCRRKNPNNEDDLRPLDFRMVPLLQSTGFYGVPRVEYLQLDWSLISALVERWRPQTHTFHLPMGEVTITLQDVGVLLGLPVDSDVVISDVTPGPDMSWRSYVPKLFGKDLGPR